MKTITDMRIRTQTATRADIDDAVVNSAATYVVALENGEHLGVVRTENDCAVSWQVFLTQLGVFIARNNAMMALTWANRISSPPDNFSF